MSDVPDTPPNASRFGSRRAVNLFILAFLAYQVAMPLRYYLGDRGYDERFSWRMFSTLRLQKCHVNVYEAAQPAAAGGAPSFHEVTVKRDVQAAWVNLLERVRMPVVEKYLARRCERQGATVKYTRNCTNTDGKPLPEQVVQLDCASRRITSSGGAAP